MQSIHQKESKSQKATNTANHQNYSKKYKPSLAAANRIL